MARGHLSARRSLQLPRQAQTTQTRQGGFVKENPDTFECGFCHAHEGDIVRNDVFGFVALCTECGYAQRATLPQLLAS